MNQPPRKSSVIHSGWYWMHVFCAAGLIALLLMDSNIMDSKFSQRQAQLERNYQGRVRAEQLAAGEKPDVPLSTAEATMITLTPLYAVLIVGLLVSWVAVWWNHFHRPRRFEREPTPVTAETHPHRTAQQGQRDEAKP